MSIVKNGEYVEREIFEWRDSDWFANLQGHGWDTVYDSLPTNSGILDNSPEEVCKDYKEDSGCYGFNYIKVKDMFNWLIEKQPWVKAGWASTYQKWLYEQKGILPEEDFPHYKPDDKDEPYYFIEYEDKYEKGKWLYDYIRDKYDQRKKDEYKNIPEDEYLIYYFDC